MNYKIWYKYIVQTKNLLLVLSHKTTDSWSTSSTVSTGNENSSKSNSSVDLTFITLLTDCSKRLWFSFSCNSCQVTCKQKFLTVSGDKIGTTNVPNIFFSFSLCATYTIGFRAERTMCFSCCIKFSNKNALELSRFPKASTSSTRWTKLCTL